MISDPVIRLVKLRMGIIKYFGNAAFSWDLKLDKMVPTNNYIFWTWCNSYYSGIAVTPILILLLYNYVIEENERLNSGEISHNSMRNLAMTCLFVMTALIIFCSMIVSILIASRTAVCAFYYACVHLNQTIQGKKKSSK